MNLDTETKERFDRATDNNTKTGIVINLLTTKDKVSEMTDLILHTIGLSKEGLPEVVILLGPRSTQSPFPVEEAIEIARRMVYAVGSERSLAELSSGRVVTFKSYGTCVREFAAVPTSEDQREVFRAKYLSDLTEYLADQDYDYIVYEPQPWLH